MKTPAPKNLNMKRRTGRSYFAVADPNNSTMMCQVDRSGIVTAVHSQDTEIPDWQGEFVTRGLIDIQVNGFAGVDFNAPGLTGAKMDHALGHLAASGVTCVLPTLITAFEPRLTEQLAELDEAVSDSVLGPLMVAGYHIEGPFLSPDEGNSGAHPAAAMRPASKELVLRLQEISSRPLCIMTVAPEQAGVLDLIPFLIERGIACAIGHTSATRAQIDKAIVAGATLSTHLGNGLPHLLNKNENPLFSQLGRDELSASFIADGIHIHPESLQSYLRAKTRDHSIIVTDAVSAAGRDLEPGIYSLGGVEIERHEDGSVRIPGSTYLAGSSATMDQMVRNLMNWYGYSMPDILLMARENPSRFVGDFATDLEIGSSANFVRWLRKGDGVQVKETSIGPFIISNAV